MKTLFVGLGSIGQRHLKNLTAACQKKGIKLDVTALRSSSTKLPDDISPLITHQLQALPNGETYDLAFITLPTNLHAGALSQLSGRIGTYFIEKPIFESTDYSLETLGLPPHQKAYVAAPMRWCGAYIALKSAIKNMPVYSVRSICSSYLPSWRANVDYRKVYSAVKEMGGGVTLDLIHEWDYLTDLFGLPQKSLNMSGQFSNLEINSDDLSVYIALYPQFLCELHLDYFGREYRRNVEIFSDNGSFTADFGSGIVTLPNGVNVDCSEPINLRYEREMDYFIDYALSDEITSINSPHHALSVLRLAGAAVWSQDNQYI